VKQFFASLLCAALFFSGPAVVPAVTAAAPAASPLACPPGTTLVQGYTKKNGTEVAAHCKKSKKGGKPDAMSASTPVPAASTPPAAPAAAPVVVPPATAAPAMKKSTSTSATSATAPEPDSTTCPEGKTYVHGYTTKKGKTVAGYCRKAPAKKSAP
jgi:hypothetical protein